MIKHHLKLSLLLVLGAVAACSTAEPTAPTPIMETLAVPTAIAEEEAPTIVVEEATQVAPTEVIPTIETASTSAENTAIPDPTDTPTDEPEVEFSAEIRPVTFSGADGLELIGTFYSAGGTQPTPTVILLHMLNSNRTVWVDFAAELNANGYNALALDMRGHGETGGTKDWTLARADHLMVMNELMSYPEIDARRMAVIGGSIGSNMALILGKDMPTNIQTVALLSPGLEYRGVTTEDAIGAYGNRPILIVASREDSYSADSSRQLTDLAFNGELILYDGAGHGTNMFAGAPELTETLLDWLNVHTSN